MFSLYNRCVLRTVKSKLTYGDIFDDDDMLCNRLDLDLMGGEIEIEYDISKNGTPLLAITSMLDGELDARIIAQLNKYNVNPMRNDKIVDTKEEFELLLTNAKITSIKTKNQGDQPRNMYARLMVKVSHGPVEIVKHTIKEE